MKIVKIESNLPDDLLRIELVLSDVCNYTCWYCFPGSNAAEVPWPKLSDIVDSLSHIIEHYRDHAGKKRFQFHITGGEPTVWKDFGKFAKYFKAKYNCLISLASNGSRTVRWWKEYGHYFDHVILSCHHERVNAAHICEVGDILYKKGVWVNAIVLMDPNAWAKCLTIVNELKRSKKRWAITAVEVFHNTITYTAEQLKYISKSNKRYPNIFYYFFKKKTIYKEATVYFDNGTKKKVPHNWIALNKHNHFKGWDCNIGVDTFFVSKQGNLQGACGEHLYGLGYKFNIYDKDFKEKFKPIVTSTTCHQSICPCIPEINATKRVIPIWPI